MELFLSYFHLHFFNHGGLSGDKVIFEKINKLKKSIKTGKLPLKKTLVLYAN